MILKIIFLVFLMPHCGLFVQVSEDDDDCAHDNLTLYYWFDFPDDGITFNWNRVSQSNCSVTYHMILTDLYADVVVEDIYLEGTSLTFRDISPCVAYRFYLYAVSQTEPVVEGPPLGMTLVFAKKPQKPPSLGTIDIRATSISMTWILEGMTNRCPLIRMLVDGGSYFNLTISLQDLEDLSTVPVEIQSLRPNSMYYFQVYVENDSGWSQATPLAVQTLELTEN